MNKKDLIIGKRYVVKPLEWFKKNDINPPKEEKCGGTFILNEINRNSVRLWKEGAFSFMVDIKGIEPDPTDKREISKEAKKLADKIKDNFKYLYTSRSCTGAGRGRVLETSKIEMIHCFYSDGNEAIELPGGDSIPAKWNLNDIKRALKGEKVSRGFRVTDHTSCTLEIQLGNNKEDIPGAYKWSSGPWG